MTLFSRNIFFFLKMCDLAVPSDTQGLFIDLYLAGFAPVPDGSLQGGVGIDHGHAVPAPRTDGITTPFRVALAEVLTWYTSHLLASVAQFFGQVVHDVPLKVENRFLKRKGHPAPRKVHASVSSPNSLEL